MARSSGRTSPDLGTLSPARLYRALGGTGLVRRLALLARDEDLGAAGDITSAASIPSRARATARVVARGPGIVAGLAALEEFRRALAPRCTIALKSRDGRSVKRGATLAVIRGPLREILAFERPALNVLGRLSGIATRTSMFVRALPRSSRAAMYDTRKTTPGMRVLEKYAVRCGGGRCHRMGLFDAVLLKDNHIAGVAPEALGAHVSRVARAAHRRAGPAPAFVEVEVDSIAQLRSVLEAQRSAPRDERIDIVLLDNMTPATMRRAAALRDRLAPRVELEASGGVTLESVPVIASTGVDRISAGSLTHGATWLDIALDIDPVRRGKGTRGR